MSILLKEKETGELVKILEPEDLYSPVKDRVTGQLQAGQNEQPPTEYQKEELIFPSGEELPRCWLDADYRLKMPPE